MKVYRNRPEGMRDLFDFLRSMETVNGKGNGVLHPFVVVSTTLNFGPIYFRDFEAQSLAPIKGITCKAYHHRLEKSRQTHVEFLLGSMT